MMTPSLLELCQLLPKFTPRSCNLWLEVVQWAPLWLGEVTAPGRSGRAMRVYGVGWVRNHGASDQMVALYKFTTVILLAYAAPCLDRTHNSYSRLSHGHLTHRYLFWSRLVYALALASHRSSHIIAKFPTGACWSLSPDTAVIIHHFCQVQYTLDSSLFTPNYCIFPIIFGVLFCGTRHFIFTGIPLSNNLVVIQHNINHGSCNWCTTRCVLLIFDWHISDPDETHVQMLRERYLCPHFRILVIGRANAGKTTILEKVCGVAKGTKPIIYDKDGKPV